MPQLAPGSRVEGTEVVSVLIHICASLSLLSPAVPTFLHFSTTRHHHAASVLNKLQSEDYD